MIPVIPKQRENRNAVNRPFSDLVRYLLVQKEQGKELGAQFEITAGVDDTFSNLIDYATKSLDVVTDDDKCIAVRTHGVTSLATATLEMNAVAEQNHRSPEPAFHFILSWPEFEKPEPEAIFDAATHAIRALGLSQHQYVIAVHDNTDNRHCHIAVNRIHPVTYKSQHLEWAKISLSIAARESEIKHGWHHDNGAYIVRLTPEGEKEIVANPSHKDYERTSEHETALPTWHDPDSLESWLKGFVGTRLKKSIKQLQNWHALHAWLDRYGIALTDTGGGGLRITATSYVTGEILELPASKGLRILKRSDLEKQWGPFKPPVEIPVIVPDLSAISPQSLAQGAQNVIDREFIAPHLYDLVHRPKRTRRPQTESSGRVPDLPHFPLDDRGANLEVLLPDTPLGGMDDNQNRRGQDLRRAGAGEEGGWRKERVSGEPQGERRRQRDPAARAERKAQRAAARADLRERFKLYRKVLNDGASEYLSQLGQIRKERSSAISSLKKEDREAKFQIKKSRLSASDKLVAVTAIDLGTTRKRAELETRYANRRAALRATRPPALGWREWLHEQSNLGDQAAVSALRGIVYQAQRDAKADGSAIDDDFDEERAAKDAAYRAAQHQRTIARLIEQERQEIAIRAARADAMRPHEMDALLIRYAGIHWHVTGNGNIEYSDNSNRHLFTDRGNRITFDRPMVTDEEIRLALMHSKQKFGGSITLSGSDPVFTARMARHADDLGLVVLNPEMAPVIAEHRIRRQEQHAKESLASQPTSSLQMPVPPVQDLQPQLVPDAPLGIEDELRKRVLAVDPRATFDVLDVDREYIGPVIALVDGDEQQGGFAQHIGRSHYVLHLGANPPATSGVSLSVRYRGQSIDITAPEPSQGKDRS